MFANPVDLQSVFTWVKRERTFRIVLADGDEYIMNFVVAGQDQGEPPHAVGNIVERVRGPEHVGSEAALLFYLADTVKVIDQTTGEIVYQAN